jgi:hypothetical protein
VEEEEINPVPFVVNPQPALATDGGEIVAELQEEGFKVADESVLRKLALQLHFSAGHEHATKLPERPDRPRMVAN